MNFKALIIKLLWLSMIAFAFVSVVNGLHVRSFLEQPVATTAVVTNKTNAILLEEITFRFTSELYTVIDAKTLTAESFNVGESASILYNKIIPAQIYIDSFIGLWFWPLTFLIISIVIAGLIFLLNYIFNWRDNKKKNILRHGTHIYTKFKIVEAIIKVKKEGKHPYQIISSWYDKNSKKTYLFKSEYLWTNPSDYIMEETITVKIDSKNKKKYIMDLSFLPEGFH